LLIQNIPFKSNVLLSWENQLKEAAIANSKSSASETLIPIDVYNY